MVFAIFLLALALRLYGIWHGMPFVYNEDEPALVRSAVGIRFDPNPGHFDWPHFHFYLTFGVLAFFYLVRGFIQVVGLQSTLMQVIPIFWKDPAIYYLITRIFNAFLGALTVVPIYLTGRVLFSNFSVILRNLDRRVGDDEESSAEEEKKPKETSLGCFLSTHAWRNLGFGNIASFLSALAFALIPFHVKDSHVATIDVPMIFWLAWSVYFAARLLKKSNWKNYIFAGVFAGLAASTKYNGIMILLVVGLAHFLRLLGRNQSEGDKPGLSSGNPGLREFGLSLYHTVTSPKLIFSGLTALLVFFLGTPYALLDWGTFWSFEYPKGVLWQFQNVGSVANFAEYFANFKRLVWTEFLPVDLSWPFYLILLFTIGEFVYMFFRFVVATFRSRSGKDEERGLKSANFSDTIATFRSRPGEGEQALQLQKEADQWSAATGETADYQCVAAPHGVPLNLAVLAFLLIFPIFYCLFVIRGKKFDSHYFLPAYPFFALIVGRCVYFLCGFVKSFIQNTKYKILDTFLPLFVAVLVFLLPLYQSFQFGIIYARPDTRTQASQWVGRNMEEGAVGAVTGTRDIQIVADGVEEDHYKNLSVLETFDKYDFIIVTKEEQEFMVEKMIDKGFNLVQQYPNTKPTRRGPHVWIYQPQ